MVVLFSATALSMEQNVTAGKSDKEKQEGHFKRLRPPFGFFAGDAIKKNNKDEKETPSIPHVKEVSEKMEEKYIPQKITKNEKFDPWSMLEGLEGYLKKTEEIVGKERLEKDEEMGFDATNQGKLFKLMFYSEDEYKKNRKGLLKKIKNLLGEKDVDVNARNSKRYWETILFYVCHAGNIELAKLLIEDYKANVNIQDDRKLTPLHQAFYANNAELAQYLIDHGAKIELYKKRLGKIFFDVDPRPLNGVVDAWDSGFYAIAKKYGMKPPPEWK